jgi:hypothetical protein
MQLAYEAIKNKAPKSHTQPSHSTRHPHKPTLRQTAHAKSAPHLSLQHRMLFNSLEFLFLYLPVLLVVFFVLARRSLTFTQIVFWVDAARGKAKELDFIHYSLFVTCFPHLIAGPVLHHKEMMPQFAQASTYRFNTNFFTVGLTIFALGLFKKCFWYATPRTYQSKLSG